MTALALCGLTAALFALRQNLYLILAVLAAAVYVWIGHGRIEDVIQDMFFSVDQEILLSVPLFILAGNIMSHGSIARRLIRLARALTAPVPGGLAVATVLSCAVFAAVSGSSTVTLLAIGPIAYPALLENGYSKPFALGALCSAGTLGIIVPPSIPLILYGVATRTSITDLFLAGIGPSLLLTALLAGYAFWRNRHLPRGAWDAVEMRAALRGSIFALFMPVLILGGIYSGHFTATESAAIAVVYAVLVELFVHRDMTLRALGVPFRETGLLVGALLPILALAISLNMFLTLERVPQALVEWLSGLIEGRLTFILVATLLMLAVGCVMEITPAVLIMGPLLQPLAASYGIDPVHFGIMMIVNLELGYLTPPMGLNIFVAMSAFREDFGTIIRAALPFLAIMLVGLIAVSLLPALSLFLLP